MGNGYIYILTPGPLASPTTGTEIDAVEGGLTNFYAYNVPIASVTKWNPTTQSWDPVSECNVWIVEP